MFPFTVCRPTSVDEAVSYLAAHPDAKLLAGGHSLVPVMKQGLAAPLELVDLSHIPALAGITAQADGLRVGAMTRHEEVCGSPVVRDLIPALAHLASNIGDPHVRHRGTMGGSLATNDPGGDYPAAALALDATVQTSKRRLRAEDYFQGMYATVLEPDEIVLAVEFCKPDWADYSSVRHPASGLALVGVFVALLGSGVRVGVTGAGGNGVFRATAFEQALDAKFAPVSLNGVDLDADDMASDIHAGGAYRASLVKTLLIRAVQKYSAARVA
jgi:carbon-monoxide dehydrogenase medium subunit